MASSETEPVLRQMLGQKPAPGAGAARSALRALRLALARVAREEIGLRLDVIGATQSTAAQEDLAGFLPDDHLLVLLDGPGTFTGGLALDPVMAAAIVQKQTTGGVSADSPVARAFTDTDAALCLPAIEAALALAADLAGQPEDRACLSGYRYGARAEDGKSLSLTLKGDVFRVFELRLDVEAGIQQASMTLVLPERAAETEEAAPGPPGTARRTAGQPAGPSLQDAAGHAPVFLSAVLCRVRTGLNELAELKVGDVLPLTGVRLDRTELRTSSGRIVARGRLGRVEGLRAVRVNETMVPDPAFALSPQEDASGPGAPPPEILARVPAAEGPPLDQMNPEEAMARISELAGLDPEDQRPDPATAEEPATAEDPA